MVAHEVNLEAMRQAEVGKHGCSMLKCSFVTQTKKRARRGLRRYNVDRQREVFVAVVDVTSGRRLTLCVPMCRRPPQASRLSHREDSAKEKNVAGDPFAAAASAARKATSLFGGDKSKDENTSDGGAGGATAAAAAKRKGEAAVATAAVSAAAETKKAKTSRTLAPSPPGNKKLREDEKNRTAHPVPFWNRTNWISGRKDGTGARGGGGGGNDPAGVAKEGAAASSGDAGKRAVGEVSGTGTAMVGSGGSSAAGKPPAAAESSKRARQEEVGAAAAGVEGVDGVAGGGVAKAPIRYQFRAGYTNAVRRPVRMRDLL